MNELFSPVCASLFVASIFNFCDSEFMLRVRFLDRRLQFGSSCALQLSLLYNLFYLEDILYSPELKQKSHSK